MRRNLWNDMTETSGRYRDNAFDAYQEGRRRAGGAVDALAGRPAPLRVRPLVVVGLLAMAAGAAIVGIVSYVWPRSTSVESLPDLALADDRGVAAVRY